MADQASKGSLDVVATARERRRRDSVPTYCIEYPDENRHHVPHAVTVHGEAACKVDWLSLAGNGAVAGARSSSSW